MRSLKVDYSKQFSGVGEKPESYRELADNFEWAKREVDQDVEGHIYDECNDLKPGGRLIVINDYCSLGVWLSPFMRLPSYSGGQQEFMLYYYGKAESRRLLHQAGFTRFDPHLCNAHMGVYHMTYLSPVWGVMLRHHRKHRAVRHKDHWERVRGSSSVNGAYPLNRPGRMLASASRRLMPSLVSLSLCCSAEKPG